MSVNNFLDVVPFSVSGLQNIQVNTINGGGFVTTINIAGQVAFLSWDSTTETLTLLIPTASGIVTGLINLSSNNTFTGNITFNGTNNTLNNNTFIGGPIFYTGATVATTPNILFYDTSTGLITQGASPFVNLLPLSNTWTGALNTFDNSVRILNRNNTLESVRIYRNENLFPTEFLSLGNNGFLTYNIGLGQSYIIDRLGNTQIESLLVRGSINMFLAGVFELGANVFAKDIDAGKIGYQTFGANNAVDIIGAGFTSTDRRVRIYDILNVNGNNTGSQNFFVNGNSLLNGQVSITGDTYLNNMGIYFRGPVDTNHGIAHNAAFDCPRMFGFAAAVELGRTNLGGFTRTGVFGRGVEVMQLFRDSVNFPNEQLVFDNNGLLTFLEQGVAFRWTLTALGDAAFRNLNLRGDGSINGNGYLEFGTGVVKELNAGRIAYQRFSSSLDIVGAGPPGSGTRFIKLYDNVAIGPTNPSVSIPLVINGDTGVNGAIQVFSNANSRNGDGMSFRAFSDFNHIINFNSVTGNLYGRIQGNGPGSILYINTSDRRLKKNFRDMPSMIESIKKMKPLEYEWIDGGKTDFGFVAQDIHKIFPLIKPDRCSFDSYCNTCDCNFDEENPLNKDGTIYPLGLDYGKMTPYLTKGLQEVIEKVETLENKVERLEKENATMQNDINNIKRALGI